ncbi:MAG TPA: hypothetical protein VHN12_03225 [Geobacteraceae bacterium]|nr:hypothetical protein [Geobacteraceae bacterium]
MNAKKHLTALCSVIALNLVTGSEAHAAATQKVYSSGILVLLFLGFCALLLVIQLVPAMMSIYGLIKGAMIKKTDTAETATD